MYYLAERFGQMVHQMEEELTPEDLAYYLAYVKIKHEDELKHAKQAKADAMRKTTVRGRRR